MRRVRSLEDSLRLLCAITTQQMPVARTHTHTDHHHTVQVARAQVQYLRQWVDEKALPAQVAEGEPPCAQVVTSDNYHLRKWNGCTGERRVTP